MTTCVAVAPTAPPPVSPLDLLRGVAYVSHSEGDGVTLRVMHLGQVYEVHGAGIKINGKLAEGANVAVIQANGELRLVVLA